MTNSEKKILAVIPARGGSKGLPGKNIRPLAGKPLIAYTIEAAKKSKYVDRVVVSSDSAEILDVAKTWGARIIQRPKELAGDATAMPPVLEHVLDTLEQENYKPDVILLLQPTCPSRTEKHIDEAISHFLANDFDSLISVLVLYKHQYEAVGKKYLKPLLSERPNRQERSPIILENGVIYLASVDLVARGKIIDGKIGYYPMHTADSVNIDSLEDFLYAETLIK